MYSCIINYGSFLCSAVKSAQRLPPSLLFFQRLWTSLANRYSYPIQHVLSVIQLVVLGRKVRLFVTLSPEVAWANQTQGSVPLTPSRVVCIWLIALVQLQVATVNLLSLGTTTLIVFIIWLAPQAGRKTQIARCDWLPEWARWSHLARSGLPAVSRMKNFPESHIINPLLTKFVWSRWLDIGLVLFLRVYGPWLRLGP